MSILYREQMNLNFVQDSIIKNFFFFINNGCRYRGRWFHRSRGAVSFLLFWAGPGGSVATAFQPRPVEWLHLSGTFNRSSGRLSGPQFSWHLRHSRWEKYLPIHAPGSPLTFIYFSCTNNWGNNWILANCSWIEYLWWVYLMEKEQLIRTLMADSPSFLKSPPLGWLSISKIHVLCKSTWLLHSYLNEFMKNIKRRFSKQERKEEKKEIFNLAIATNYVCLEFLTGNWLINI